MEPAGGSALNHLPLALAVTAVVVAAPSATAAELRAGGVISSLVALIMLSVALSLFLVAAGSALWSRRRCPDDLLFSELLLWGWFRRLRTERKLRNGEVMLRDLEEGRQTDLREVVEKLSAVAAVFEAQDRYLDGHSRRVACHSALVARRMGLSREEVGLVRAAAAVHDVGKLRIPAAILDKPAALTDEEFELIKRHPDEGAALVAPLCDPGLTSIVRHHHERLDGTGYPAGLAGDQIPLGARIVAVADTFDAITSARPYRPPAPHRRAIEILRREAGTQLDPEAVDVFIRCYAGRRSVMVWAALSSGIQGAFAASGQATAALRGGLSSLAGAGATAATVATLSVLAIAQPALAPRDGGLAARAVTLSAMSAVPVTLAGSTATAEFVDDQKPVAAAAGQVEASAIRAASVAASAGGRRSGPRRSSGGRSGSDGPGGSEGGGPGSGSTGASPTGNAAPSTNAGSTVGLPGPAPGAVAPPAAGAPSAAGAPPAASAPPAAGPAPATAPALVVVPALTAGPSATGLPAPAPAPGARSAPAGARKRHHRHARPRHGSASSTPAPSGGQPRPAHPPAQVPPLSDPPPPPAPPAYGDGGSSSAEERQGGGDVPGDNGLHHGVMQGRGNAASAPGNQPDH